jgi:hypothetical protein
MNRLRAALAFAFTGGMLIFLSPYLVYKAAIKDLPWAVPMIVIPIYATLSYGAFKTFWPHIIRKSGTGHTGEGRTQQK